MESGLLFPRRGWQPLGRGRAKRPPRFSGSNLLDPGRGPRGRGLIQIFRIIRNPRLFQHGDNLFAKRLRLVMLFLIGDIFPYRRSGCGADGEGRVTILPCELFSKRDGFMDPRGGGLLQFPDEIRQAMGGLQTDQEMNVVRHTTNTFRLASHAMDDSTQVFVESWPPFDIDERHPILCPEYEVVVKGQVGGCHDGKMIGRDRWCHAFLALLPECGFISTIGYRGGRFARPRANGWNPFGMKKEFRVLENPGGGLSFPPSFQPLSHSSFNLRLCSIPANGDDALPPPHCRPHNPGNFFSETNTR